jgi:lipopolysaccharide export system permease protein
MRVLRRYLLVSFFRLVTITTLLLSFILLLFDLFSHLEQYLQAEIALRSIVYATILYFPEAIVFAIPPSALFASTYILSMMHTHNEMIILNNSGISFRRLVSILIIASLFLSIFQFFFNEEIAIKAHRIKNDYTQEILNQNVTSDNRNITLYGFDRSYIVYARRFTEIDNRITQVSLYHLDKEGSLLERVDATTGVYNEGSWTLQNANIYSIKNNEAEYSFLSSYTPSYFTLEPSFFANKNNEVITMDLPDALRYVESIKLIRKNEFSLIASDVYNRIFKNLAPLILILISCSTVFAWKKNVLMLSIIMSISIAVVFYVMLLMGMILAKQGVIHPMMGTLGPMVILFFASILTLSFKRK